VVVDLLRYMPAKNYQTTVWFDKVIANIKWYSFFNSHCTRVWENTNHA